MAAPFSIKTSVNRTTELCLIKDPERNAFDNTPWIIKLVEFVQELLKQNRIRIIGVCFGHQIIGRAMGAKVDRSTTGWEASVTPMDLTEKGKELFRQDKMVRIYLLQAM